MIDPVVRHARSDDVDELIALSGAARAALADQRGGPRWLEEHPVCEDWTTRLDDPLTSVLVADLDGLVVGYLVAVVDGRIVNVDEVYVRPEARELGFGDTMLADALEFGRARGASLVEGEALPGDRTIKNLFERAGITARKIIVSAALSDPASAAGASR